MSAFAALVGSMAIWGSTFVVTEAVLDEADPLFVVAARLAIALAVLWPLLATRGGERLVFPLRREFAVLGLLGVVGNFGLQTVALEYTGAADAALIVALTPLPTAVLAALFLRERLARLQLVGIAVSIAGVVLITGFGGEAGAAVIVGDLLIAASTLSWAAYTLVGKRLAATQTAATITVAGTAWGLVFLAPAAAVEMVAGSPPSLSFGGIAALVYLGVAASGLTFLLWNYALRYVDASVAGTFVNLVPVFGLAFAVLAGDSLSPLELAGGAAVGVGVWLAARAVGRDAKVRADVHGR